MSTFDEHDKERYLARRIYEQSGVDIFEGLTDRTIRHHRARQAIIELGAAVICGRDKDGKPQPYSQVFESVYDAPLVPPQAKRASSRESQWAATARDAEG